MNRGLMGQRSRIWGSLALGCLFMGLGSFLGLGGFSPCPASADDWHQWRGPNREGRSNESGLMVQWPSSGPKQLWTNTDTGLGYGGIAVVDGTVFTMGSRGDQEFVIAVDAATGQEKWSSLMGSLLRNNWGDGPRSTPTVVGDRVYALSGQGNLVCLDKASGELQWQVKLTDLGGRVPQWGYAESPLVDDGRVIVTPGGSRGAIVALNKDDGEVLWQTEDFTDAAQYSSAIIAHPHGQKQYVHLLMNSVVGIEPETGAVLWRVEWPGKTAVIPTPIAVDNRVYVTSGYGVGCMMVELDEKNEVREVYRNQVMKNHHGGVIRVGDYLFGYSDGPGWMCQELATGEDVWTDSSLGKGCVTFAGGMLYMLAEDTGEVALVEPTDVIWRERGRFRLSPQSEQRARSGRIWTHPVVSGGKLYLKDQEILYCYDVSR